jgi:hypothetical protein
MEWSDGDGEELKIPQLPGPGDNKQRKGHRNALK